MPVYPGALISPYRSLTRRPRFRVKTCNPCYQQVSDNPLIAISDWRKQKTWALLQALRYTLAMTRAAWGLLLTLLASAFAFVQDKPVDPAPPHIYHVGEGVSLPKATFSPTPEYTTQAAKKKIEGTVLLSLIVLPDGTPRNVAVSKGLGYGLDEQAVKAVSTWRFQPAVRQSDGEAVPISITIETTFHVYHKPN